MLFDHDINRLDDVGIAFASQGGLVVGRPRQADAAATALYREMMLGNQVRNGITLLRRP